MKRKVLDIYLPMRLPISRTALLWLLLDRIKPAEWVWGAVGLFWLLYWSMCIYGVFTQESVKLKEEAFE